MFSHLLGFSSILKIGYLNFPHSRWKFRAIDEQTAWNMRSIILFGHFFCSWLLLLNVGDCCHTQKPIIFRCASDVFFKWHVLSPRSSEFQNEANRMRPPSAKWSTHFFFFQITSILLVRHFIRTSNLNSLIQLHPHSSDYFFMNYLPIFIHPIVVICKAPPLYCDDSVV